MGAGNYEAFSELRRCDPWRGGCRSEAVGSAATDLEAAYVVLSFLYWAFRRLLELLALCLRSEQSKEIEILVLRHQLHVLRREVARPKLRRSDRALLPAFSRVRPRRGWRSFLVQPTTLLRWHRELVRRRWIYQERRPPGRPSIASELRQLILRMAAENPTWGYRRIQGELSRLGISVAPSTVWAVLRRHGVEPAPRRASLSWADFLHRQAAGIMPAISSPSRPSG